MQSLFAYMLSVWCYVVAIVAILWLVPHVCRKYGLGAQVCVLLLAMASVVVGYEAWSVAEGGVDIADYWLFRKSLMPAATTSIIIGEYARYATRRRKERLKRIKLLADNIWHLAVEHVERQSRQELLQIKAALLAEVKSLKDRLDAQLLKEAESKSDFDLFHEQYLKSRDKQ